MSIVRMRKNMQGWFRPIMLAVAIVMAIAIVYQFIGPGGKFQQQEDTQAGGVIARVNGEKLGGKAFEELYRRELLGLARQRGLAAADKDWSGIEQTLGPFATAQIRGQIFDRMVDETLLLQAAEREGVRVSRRELRAKIKQYMEDQFKQIKEIVLAGHRGEKTDNVLEAELEKQGLSIDKLRSNIKKDIDPDSVRKQLTIEKLMEKLKNKVDASDKAVRESYDEVRLAQITIGTGKRSAIQAEQRAKELVAKLRKGADFAALARSNSEDPYSIAGGDREGFLGRAGIESELADIAFKLKPGEVSDPIKTSQGFVVLKVEARRSNLPADFNDPKKLKGYREAYLTQEQARVQRKYYENLHKTAKIEVYDSDLKGYLLVKELPGMLTNRAQLEAKLKEAIKEYQRAAVQAGERSDIAGREYAQVGFLYNLMRRPGLFSPNKEEQVTFRNEARRAFETALEHTESNDLRMMLADIYIEEGKYDKAVESMEIVADNAYDDPETHKLLLQRYESMKGSGSQKIAELIAGERKWIDEYNKQRAGTPAPPSP